MPPVAKQIDLKGQGLVEIKGLTIVVDPKDDKVAKKDRKTPANSGPTKDDHRFTVSAPTPDESVFSVGKGSAAGIEHSSLKHIKDTGITGRTKSHVHFETTGDPQTILSLGGPATDSRLISDFFQGVVPRASVGYSMVTKGDAVANSLNQFYIVSDMGDVQIHSLTQNVNVQATERTVSIEAGKHVTVAAHEGGVTIGACPTLEPEDARYQTPLACTVGQALSDSLVTNGLKGVSVAASVLGFAQGFPKTEWQSFWGKKGRSTTSALGTLKVLADAAKLTSTLGRWIGKGYLEETGKVGIHGASAASMSGGLAASIYGGLSASVTSLLSASLLGLVSASVKGIGWTSVWSGLGTSIKSMKDASLEGQLGKAKVSGKAGVELLSVAGKVSVDGEKGIQVTSGQSVLLHSPFDMKLVVGAQDGYGLAATQEGLRIGRISSGASSFASALPKQTKAFEINQHGIHMQYDKTAISLAPDGISVDLDTTQVLVGKGGDLKLNADGKIFLA